MAETETETITTTVSPPPLSESESSSTAFPTTKNESEEDTMNKPGGISLRIWPPTQKTRDAVVNRLIETLSTESILSKRYGTLKSEEASSIAKSIEDEAYGIASSAVLGDDDGIEVLKAYSKEISKRMLESVKARTPIADDAKTDSDSIEAVKDEEAFADSVKLEA
ncbi:WPP domain-containing protein 1 [Cardamine amara subsp. amara]|uniref:WPP domain-containing protein 1 n=1 Tax=Cardamine amara subsp. amara TaxID=228776 RepID=A0ABD1BU97_CARAN